ncbi:F-box protein [Citrus sinensis]|nr:F-box protein [Citrus sinensis]
MQNSDQALPVKDRRPDALGDLKIIPDEIICSILEHLTPRDVGRLACVSSVMYIFCNEEPLWMSLCLKKASGVLQYKGSWKKTALHLCHTVLDGFSFDSQLVKRKKIVTREEFDRECAEEPILLSGLADTWPARNTWTIDQLLTRYGDTAFRISQRSVRSISMKFKDYVAYMNVQHDEDPLYIFDYKFGENAQGLLEDYRVPDLFQEDLFNVLDGDMRPSYRWVIIGPQRSGASWHVDPALTSAWNTLLCGRKRWALYPPGRVPLGVTVHVNEDDGDVNIETPSSLEWWLDFYPLLADDDKPIECTQLPGETIVVPSGWWHCVLNLETTIAVTQNFVNSKNFEFVCLDFAPGYRHKGVCRAGLLALEEESLEGGGKNTSAGDHDMSYPDLTRKEKRVRVNRCGEIQNHEEDTNGASKNYNSSKQDFSYDINFLAKFLDEDRDHYNFPWSSGNCTGKREMREWLYKLWVGKPEMRELIWKGACLALNAGKWLELLEEICNFHKLPTLTAEEKLPVGNGSNPVYLMADCVVKIFVEGGFESSIYGLGTELEFYSLLAKVNSPLKNYIPDVLASGILYVENGSYTIVPWDGKGVLDVIGKCNLTLLNCKQEEFPFGIWSKKQFEYRSAWMSVSKLSTSDGCNRIWPYIITKRCKGKMFAQLRDALSGEDVLNLASFLGEQLRNLHLLPCPPFNESSLSDKLKTEPPFNNGFVEDVVDTSSVPAEWEIFIRTLARKKKNLVNRLTAWGHPIPKALIDKVDEYIPDDFVKLLDIYQDENGLNKVCKPCSWIHSDIMDDNVYMEPCCASSRSNGNAADTGPMVNGSTNGYDEFGEAKSWHCSHIIDFSNLSIGDPIYDVIPIHLDIFRGDSSLFKQFLESYKLPLVRRMQQHGSGGGKFSRLSYHAMPRNTWDGAPEWCLRERCYCILHDDNVLGTIFSTWKELRTAKSWEEVEMTQWRLIGRARLSKHAWEPDYRSKFADQSEVTVVHLHLPSYDGGIVVAALY